MLSALLSNKLYKLYRCYKKERVDLHNLRTTSAASSTFHRCNRNIANKQQLLSCKKNTLEYCRIQTTNSASTIRIIQGLKEYCISIALSIRFHSPETRRVGAASAHQSRAGTQCPTQRTLRDMRCRTTPSVAGSEKAVFV